MTKLIYVYADDDYGANTFDSSNQTPLLKLSLKAGKQQLNWMKLFLTLKFTVMSL